MRRGNGERAHRRFPRTSEGPLVRRFLFAAIVIAALLAGGAVAAARPILAVMMSRALTCTVSVERVELAGTTMRVRGVHAERCKSLFDFDVDVATLEREALLLHDAQLTVMLPAAAPFPLRLAHVEGAMRRYGERVRYSLRFRLGDDSGAAPVALRGESSAEDAAFRVVAKTLPVSALSSIAAVTPGLVPRGGLLADVDVQVNARGPRVGGGFIVRDAAFGFGTHRLHALNGTVALQGDGFTTDPLAGMLDDAPVAFRGTLHLTPHRGGTDDPSLLGALVARIADAPQNDPDLGPLRGVSFESLGPALLFAEASMSTQQGPRVFHVLGIDPHAPTIKIDTVLAHDKLVSTGLQTSSLARTSGAAAGVNGDYFDIGRTYQPQGMYAHNGELLRSPSERAVLSIMQDGRISVGTYSFGGALRDGARTYRVTRLNDFAEYVSVITPALGTMLPVAGETFAALEPVNRAAGRYRITRIGRVSAGEPAEFGVAFGAKITEPLPRAGDLVSLTYGTQPSLAGVSAVIGGGPQLLRDGQWYEDPHPAAPDERDVRWPVVAAGRLADDRILMVAVDGRHPERAVGMTRPEFAKLLQTLGVIDAFALDSGGSVTMVARATLGNDIQVRNRPSDNDGERFVTNGLFVFSSAPPDLPPQRRVVFEGGAR